MQDSVNIMPIFCEKCIHRLVCRYIEQVKKWEDNRKNQGTGTDWKVVPIQIHCEMKENDCRTVN